MIFCCVGSEISISDTHTSRGALVKVRLFICVHWQAVWNVLLKSCQSLPFLFASLRLVNTSICKWEPWLCLEPPHTAWPASPRGTPVVWHLSQLLMCQGSWAKSSCQIIVLGRGLKNVKVCFIYEWHVVRLKQPKSFAGVLTRMSWPGFPLHVMSPPPLMLLNRIQSGEQQRERSWLEMWRTPWWHTLNGLGYFVSMGRCAAAAVPLGYVCAVKDRVAMLTSTWATHVVTSSSPAARKRKIHPTFI